MTDTETATATRVRLYGWVPRTDYLAATSGTFAQLVRLSREAGHVHYLGDLYHDAVYLGRELASMVADDRDSVTLYFQPRESGTSIWTDPDQTDGVYRSVWPDAPVWRITVSHELDGSRGDGVWYATVEAI